MTVSVGSLSELDASKIAEVFLDPTKRMIAEREIERLARLPLGSVAIHCPPAHGPRKIANILVTFGEDDPPVRLRNIANLDRPVFAEHQNAVLALEKMYQSTWRLMVSVAPPHAAKWKEVNEEISKVLYQLLSEGDVLDQSVPNDRHMIRELKGAGVTKSMDDDECVHVVDPDGKERDIPVTLFRFMHSVTESLRRSGQFEGVFQTAHVGRESVSAEGAYREAVQKVENMVREFCAQTGEAAPLKRQKRIKRLPDDGGAETHESSVGDKALTREELWELVRPLLGEKPDNVGEVRTILDESWNELNRLSREQQRWFYSELRGNTQVSHTLSRLDVKTLRKEMTELLQKARAR
jgi:hypothetical protein